MFLAVEPVGLVLMFGKVLAQRQEPIGFSAF